MTDDDWKEFRHLLIHLCIWCNRDELLAERCRDQLDVYWARMTEAERQQARDLSIKYDEAVDAFLNDPLGQLADYMNGTTYLRAITEDAMNRGLREYRE